MRNTTKLKHILQHNTLDVSIENGLFQICIFSKKNPISDEDLEQNTVTGKSWSEAIGKAYRQSIKTTPPPPED